jgi:hypothetical protein
MSRSFTISTSHNITHTSRCLQTQRTQDFITILVYNAISHRGGPGSRPGLVKWDLWWTKWRWSRFSPSTSVSPANLHSTNCSTITLIYHLGLYNRPEVAAVPGDVSPTPLKKYKAILCSEAYFILEKFILLIQNLKKISCTLYTCWAFGD